MDNIKNDKSKILLNNVSKILKDVMLEDSNEINKKKNAIFNRQEIIKNKDKYKDNNKNDYNL